MRMSEVFPSRFLKADDIGDTPKRLVIQKVALEEFDDGKPKVVLAFIGQHKGLVANKTNVASIVAAYGDESDGWIGKPLVLYVAEVAFQGKTVPAIRVRVPKPAAPAKPAPAPQQPNDDGGMADMADDIPFDV